MNGYYGTPIGIDGTVKISGYPTLKVDCRDSNYTEYLENTHGFVVEPSYMPFITAGTKVYSSMYVIMPEGQIFTVAGRTRATDGGHAEGQGGTTYTGTGQLQRVTTNVFSLGFDAQIAVQITVPPHANITFWVGGIEVSAGTILRYADYDRDIALPDGRVFNCTGPRFRRDRIKMASGIAVDKMTITGSVDENDMINGTTFMRIAHTGGFDNANLTLYKCIMSSPGIAIGAIDMFGGYVDLKSGGGLEMKWTVKSGIQMLNVEYPIKKYLPTCPNCLYDNACGVDITAHTATGTVNSVTSASDFTTSVSMTDGYYEEGGIEFTSGALSGVSAPIKTSYQSNGRIVMLVPLDITPGIGDTFKVYPGCNKTYDVCVSRFNNGSRNRSAPYIPLKETIV